jgi:hypothetical protein
MQRLGFCPAPDAGAGTQATPSPRGEAGRRPRLAMRMATALRKRAELVYPASR